MNILIIGYGTAGKFYMNVLQRCSHVKKIYVFDPAKKKINSRIFLSKFDLNKVKKLKISHAIIATPSNLHYKYSKLLLENSINLLIEKPFVLKISDAKDLIKINKLKKVKCWVTFQNRYNLAIQRLRKYIDARKLGNIFLTDCNLIWSRDKKYYKTSWKGKYKSDGGVLANQAIHLLDAVIYIFGEVKKFNSILRFNKKKLQAEDLIVLNFIHKNNLISSLKATTRADVNYTSGIDVIGEKGRALVNGISLNYFNTFTKGKLKKDKKYSEEFSSGPGSVGAMGNGHLKILDEFLDKKIKRSSKDLEITKNLHVLKIIHSVYNFSSKSIFNFVKDKQSRLGI